ncbi:transporter [Azonexus hydrophilus]|uniref:transporter n=1 Tax=Azonexus hydrophilus TaxID=418702 RepID=UPI00048F2A37|nr:transporter [Azonexus hydrophilus]
MNPSFLAGCLLAVATIYGVTPVHAAALDILPGDYVALQPGQYGVTTYFYDRRLEGPYRAGSRSNRATVDAGTVALRFSGYGLVGGKTWAWSVTPLWSKAQLTEGTMPAVFGREARGAGDVRLSTTIWPLADRERGEYLGITLAWFEPTGHYSNRRVLNIGENRRKLSIAAGWSTPLASTLRLELIPELTFHGTNKDYLVGRERKQDVSVALTGYLRWRVAQQWELMAGAQTNAGGETRINGVEQNDEVRNKRLMLGGSYFFDQNTVLSLRYGSDTVARNGFRLEREWLLRVGRRF